MAKAKAESVYDFITRMSAGNPGLPYDFQHLSVAGASDVRSIFYPSRLSEAEREKLAMEVVELAVAGTKAAAARRLLRQRLDEKSLYLYVSKLMPRLFLLLSEKAVDEKSFYALGYKMATQSSHGEEVKLGMLILGCFENDFVRQIVRTLGLHSSFTLFAVEASERFADRNEFLFDLLRNTSGYGKMAALAFFEPVLQNQKRWVFDNGAFNETDPNTSAIICIEKVDMIKFFGDLVLTKSNFSKLSYLLAYAAEEQPISSFGQGLLLAEKLLDSADLFARSFIDLAAIAVLKKSIAAATESEDEPDWPAEKADVFNEKCRALLSQPNWKKTVFRELGNPCQTSSLIILVLSETGILPGFFAFTPMLERDPFDLYLFYFVLVSHPETYLLDAAVTLEMTLPEDLFGEDPQELPVDSWLPEYRPNTCLIFLLRALRKAHIEDEELFIKCLTARYPDTRFEAILALRVFKNSWSNSVYPALERTCRLEPVKGLEKNLRRLMEPVNPDKEQRYAETTGIRIKPSPLDICLLETEIAGTQYRDLQIVEGYVEAGDILYLMREPQNKYDHKAILVTADDGYVLGYVPRDENEMPAALMDNGEKLYAVFTGRNLEDLYPGIRIMCCKEPEKAGKVLKFPPEDSSERFEPQIGTQRPSVPDKGKTDAPRKNGAETSRVILYESRDSDNQVIIEAYLTEGALHIDGHDLGKSVEDFWGEDEYEYYYSLSKEETEKLYELLKRESNSDKSLLELVAINFNGNECDVNFREFCENNSIAVEFFSWF